MSTLEQDILRRTRQRRVGDRREEILELLKQTPGFAGGTLQDLIDQSRPQPALQEQPRKYFHEIGETPVHTKPGGLDMYSDVNRKQGERPVDAIRREDMQRAAIGLGDPIKGGEATFAPPDDRRLNLDYVPTGERTRPRTVATTPPVPSGHRPEPVLNDPKDRVVSEELQRAAGTEVRPWKAGYGVGETDPLKRESARIRAMIENPTSKVSPTGSVDAPHPMSRKKASLLGALFGLAQGDRKTTLAERLAAGGTGALIGGVKPRAIQEWQRRMEVEDAQGQLAQQTKLGLGQAQLESEQAEARQRQIAPELALIESERKARYDRERLRVQQEAAEGRISIAQATQKLREMELEERKRHNLETENISRTRPASDAQAAQAAEGEAIAEVTQAAANELKGELDQQKGQLMENERAIAAKEAWWNRQAAKRVAESGGELKIADALLQVQAEDPDYQSGGHGQLLNNTKSLREAVGEKEKELKRMADDVRKGSAKAARGSSRRRAAPYTGRTMSSANLARYAKDKGITIEAAKAQVEAQGVRVQ